MPGHSAVLKIISRLRRGICLTNTEEEKHDPCSAQCYADANVLPQKWYQTPNTSPCH